MGGRRATVAVAAALALLALPPAGAEAGREVFLPPGPDPVVERWPEWPWPVECDYRTQIDPVESFSRPATAEYGSRPSERALRRWLAWQRRWWPPRGWDPLHRYRRVYEGPRRAVFTRGRLGTGHGELSPRGVRAWYVEKRQGRWRWSSIGTCAMRSEVGGPPGPVIPWRIAAEQKRIGPDTTSLLVDLGEGDCGVGDRRADRILEPIFGRIGSKLVMVLRLARFPCTIREPVRVELPEPLGYMHLFDGANYPPVFSEYQWRLRKGDEETLRIREEIRERIRAERRDNEQRASAQ